MKKWIAGHQRTHNDEEIIEVKGHYRRTSEMHELLAWAKQGLRQGLDTIRGTHMFGASAKVRVLDEKTLEIETREEGVTVYWELKLTKLGSVK